ARGEGRQGRRLEGWVRARTGPAWGGGGGAALWFGGGAARAEDPREGGRRGAARPPPAKPLHLGSRGSCLLRCGDPVDPTALLLARGEGEPQLLLQGSREEAADRVPLPAHCARHFIDRCTLGALQHCDHRVLL